MPYQISSVASFLANGKIGNCTWISEAKIPFAGRGNQGPAHNHNTAHESTSLWIWKYIIQSGQGPHDDVIKWKHLPRHWPIVRGIQRSPVNSPHKVQWRGALMFPLICAWINVSANNREAGDLRRYRAHYDVIVMIKFQLIIGPIGVPNMNHVRILNWPVKR